MSGTTFIGLCHFCDLHGPSFVWYTEKLNIDDLRTSKKSQTASRLQDSENSWSEHAPHCVACSPHNGKSDSQPVSVSELGDGSGEAYISTGVPVSVKFHPKKMKELSIRSLSNEVSLSKDAPVIFSDDSFTVLSFTFYLRDFFARGHKRLYSIVVVSEVQSLIMNNVDRMMKNVNRTVENVKNMADQTFYRISLAERFPSSMIGPKLISTADRPRSAPNNLPSNLCDVVGDLHIFQWLHIQFSRILELVCLEPALPSRTVIPVVLTDEDRASIRSVTVELQQKKEHKLFTKLLYVLLSSAGSLERVIFNVKQQAFSSWPGKLVSMLAGKCPDLKSESIGLLKFRLGYLTAALTDIPSKESVFASRLALLLGIENSSARIVELQIRVLANQIQSLLEVHSACKGQKMVTYPGLKVGDIEILNALSVRRNS